MAIRTKIAFRGYSGLQYLEGNRRSKELGCDKPRYHWGQVTLGQKVHYAHAAVECQTILKNWGNKKLNLCLGSYGLACFQIRD